MIQGSLYTRPTGASTEKAWESPFYSLNKTPLSEIERRERKSYEDTFCKDTVNVADQRELLMKSFNKSGQINILLITQRAGGAGISLPEAKYCVLYNTENTPNLDEQAMMRGLRASSKTGIRIYRLVMAESMEEWSMAEYVQRMKRSYMITDWKDTEEKRDFYSRYQEQPEPYKQEVKALVDTFHESYTKEIKNRSAEESEPLPLAHALESKEYFGSIEEKSKSSAKHDWWYFQGKSYKGEEEVSAVF